MRWADVEHQDRAVALLRRALRNERLHHAYLFGGPDGVGKELAARVLAARLLCAGQGEPDADPCGQCPSCRLLAGDNHPDFHLIHRGLHKQHPERSVRASKGLFLVVDIVRHFLIEPSTNRPALGRRRVFVVRDAERMNEGAQNALLKTLEEPPGAACLILVTSSADRLLPTIRSRCQVVPFGELPTTFVAEQLAARTDLGGPQAATLAGLAHGRLGAALRWHALDLLATWNAVAAALAARAYEQPETFGKALLEQATALAQRAAAAEAEPDEDGAGEAGRSRRKAAPKTVETDQLRDALKLVLALVAAVLRDGLRHASGAAGAGGLPADVARALAAQPLERLGDGVEGVVAAERMLDRNVAPQLVCERLAVGLSGDAQLPA